MSGMSGNECSLNSEPNPYSSEVDYRRQYHLLNRKHDALKEEHETVRKRCSELFGSQNDLVSKLELAQEESFWLRKSFEDCIQNRNAAIQERNGLKQQCTAAIRQWDQALRENKELKEELTKVKQHRDEAMKEINQAMAARIKATKDMARLTEERNDALHEYNLIMSERDSVHKEIEKLQEEQQLMQKRIKQLESEKKVLTEETESLKREISSALFDSDRVLKVCNDLREKYNDYVTGMHEEVISPTTPQSRSGYNFWGSSSSGVSTSWAHMMSKSTNLVLSAASSNSSVSTFSHPHNKLSSNSRLDDIDQANTEIEILRKQMERLQTDLGEAQQEVEVCKRRRDWAFSERNKIVLERESMRTLCDKLRRERDRAVSDLAEALLESDDIKRQKNETTKELKEVKEKMEDLKGDRASKMKTQTQNSQLGTNNSSRDSAIEADLQEYEIETMNIALEREHKSKEWGFTLSSHDNYLLVDSVNKDSAADGKLKVNDIVIKLNDNLLTNQLKLADDLLKKNDLQIVLTVQRKNVTRFVQTITLNVDKGQDHGLVLETGYYVSRINAGSVAAKEGNLAVGDRILYINEKAIDQLADYDIMQLLDSHNVLLQVIKNSTIVSPSHSSSSTVNSSKSIAETNSKSANLKERQKKMVSCCSQTDNFMTTQPTTRPPVPSDYQTFSRNNGKRNSGIIKSMNKSLISTLSNSSNSSTSPVRQVQSPPAPTLLDKAYNKLIGDRKFFGHKKQSSKSKQTFCEDETKTLDELDKVLDKYNNEKVNDKPSKYSKSGKSSKKEKNGGTWPKYRGHSPVLSLQNYTNLNATLHPIKRKERKSLGIFANTFNKLDKSDKVYASVKSPATKKEPDQSSNTSIKDERMSSSNFMTFEPASEAALIEYERNSKRNSALSARPISLQSSGLISNNSSKAIYSSIAQPFSGSKADTLDFKVYRPTKPMATSPLDYSVVSAQSKDKNVLDYYKYRTNLKQLRPHSVHDVLTDATQPPLSLAIYHSSYDSFHSPNAPSPSPVPNAAPIAPMHNSTALYSLKTPSALLPSGHAHHNYFTNPHLTRGTGPRTMRHSTNSAFISPYISRSGDSLLGGNESQMHSHDSFHSRSASAYQGGFRPYAVKETLVNKYGITPSPSFMDKASSLILSDRGSPMPCAYRVEWLTPSDSGSSEVDRIAKPGDVRRIEIYRNSAPSLGINIKRSTSRGVFVSDVNENSLAAYVGLLIGDQLLDICGINMRTANYENAAPILRKCINEEKEKFTLLVRYNPDNFREDNDSDGAEADEEDNINTIEASFSNCLI